MVPLWDGALTRMINSPFRLICRTWSRSQRVITIALRCSRMEHSSPGARTVTAIAGGRYHSLALKRTGSGPVITTPPHNAFALAGTTVSFGVLAAGATPLAY